MRNVIKPSKHKNKVWPERMGFLKKRVMSRVRSKLTGKTKSVQIGLRAREVEGRNVAWPDLAVHFQI